MTAFAPLLELLREVPDPRRAEGKLYQLPHVLLFSILAIVSGGNSYRSVVTFIEVHRLRLNATFGLAWRRAPAHTSIRFILQGLDTNALEGAFRQHAGLLQAACASSTRGSLAIDGKTLRGSFDRFHDRAAAQLLSVFATDTALLLAHLDIDEKSNEIPAAQALLAELGLAGHLVTLDALHCQKKTCEAAAATKADLIVQIKDNQPTLLDKVRQRCAEAEPLSGHVGRNRGRNRAEERLVAVFDPARTLADTEWAGHVAALLQVERNVLTRNATSRSWTRSTETAFYLSTTSLTATRAASAIRAHWHIENTSHHSRDVTLGEDRSRIRTKPGVFARLRSFAFNILKVSRVGTLSQDRFRAALGGLPYLLDLLVIRQR